MTKAIAGHDSLDLLCDRHTVQPFSSLLTESPVLVASSFLELGLVRNLFKRVG